MTSIDGYIIANRQWSPDSILRMGKHTFGMTAGEAWRRHVGGIISESGDFSVYVQRWSDKGFGPHKVTLTLAA
ncbi:hypothetical protein FJ959_08695 [Mesorhizobium sp. B2-2-4]|uniref:hypothetical protein n=1 Tax=Mesorhizobium sp. B2-2-4 TaxID=2589962 RepID=UPI001128B274|nr:hypothetical protein [Mesorhizobium sp. B2-2-4]TPM58944.1 hypothetical protein FJ959_08695 [Mesorhizobium sp. B2-2-4]